MRSAMINDGEHVFNLPLLLSSSHKEDEESKIIIRLR